LLSVRFHRDLAMIYTNTTYFW